MLQTRILLDSNGQDLAVEHVQDVEPILERNKVLRTLQQKSDCTREVADIPYVTLITWLNEEHARGNTGLLFLSAEFNQIVKKKLSDPDWAYLRTDSHQVQSFMGFGS